MLLMRKLRPRESWQCHQTRTESMHQRVNWNQDTRSSSLAQLPSDQMQILYFLRKGCVCVHAHARVLYII